MELVPRKTVTEAIKKYGVDPENQTRSRFRSIHFRQA